MIIRPGRGRAGVRPIGRGIQPGCRLVPMHPPFSFRSCRKENGPCTVQKKRTLRRVGLRQRRPPAAGGGWSAVPRGSQGRKRAALGVTVGTGRSGIHPAPLSAAANDPARERLNGDNLWSAHTAGKRWRAEFSRAEAVMLSAGVKSPAPFHG